MTLLALWFSLFFGPRPPSVMQCAVCTDLEWIERLGTTRCWGATGEAACFLESALSGCKISDIKLFMSFSSDLRTMTGYQLFQVSSSLQERLMAKRSRARGAGTLPEDGAVEPEAHSISVLHPKSCELPTWDAFFFCTRGFRRGNRKGNWWQYKGFESNGMKPLWLPLRGTPGSPDCLS